MSCSTPCQDVFHPFSSRPGDAHLTKRRWLQAYSLPCPSVPSFVGSPCGCLRKFAADQRESAQKNPGYSGGPKGDIVKGDIWKWDFALKFALENGISHWNSHTPRHFSLLFLRQFHRERPSRHGKRRLDGTAQWKMPFWDVFVQDVLV